MRTRSRSQRRKIRKHIFVTGGVVSSLGKGLTAASIGMLLERRGLKVAMQKIDPYLNVDPGTMSPFQHGEVYVLDDGTEADLDLGHYERFTNARLTRASAFTAGRVYHTVLEKERRGDYLGKTVQVVPHVTDEIKRLIKNYEEDADVVISELGGTIGDIEGLPFLEAIRQLSFELGRNNSLFIHLTLLPYLKGPGEVKTKPTQHSVQKMREIGLQPDILICRSEVPVSADALEKISLFTNVEAEAVFVELDVSTSIYEIPLILREQGLDRVLLKYLDIDVFGSEFTDWQDLISVLQAPARRLKIAVVGKYTELQDAYKSIYESLVHAGLAHRSAIEILPLSAEDLEASDVLVTQELAEVDGLLVPGGFGARGFEGKIRAIRYAREQGLPFFGICLGMQAASVEFARSVLGLHGANSSEFDTRSAHRVIDLMEEQRAVQDKGGTMRLGACPCDLAEDSKARRAYAQERVLERHRHRFEFNNTYRDAFKAAGMLFSGLSPDGRLVEIIELPTHPWFVACQFHPEFRSKPIAPHPLFRDFIGAAARHHDSKKRPD
jgi:CTP synthase